jgi:hypothetical protein
MRRSLAALARIRHLESLSDVWDHTSFFLACHQPIHNAKIHPRFFSGYNIDEIVSMLAKVFYVIFGEEKLYKYKQFFLIVVKR